MDGNTKDAHLIQPGTTGTDFNISQDQPCRFCVCSLGNMREGTNNIACCLIKICVASKVVGEPTLTIIRTNTNNSFFK